MASFKRKKNVAWIFAGGLLRLVQGRKEKNAWSVSIMVESFRSIDEKCRDSNRDSMAMSRFIVFSRVARSRGNLEQPGTDQRRG